MGETQEDCMEEVTGPLRQSQAQDLERGDLPPGIGWKKVEKDFEERL